MKFQRALRMQLIVAGLGGMLLLPSAVQAQQEVDPEIFDVNPATPQVNQAAVVQQEQNADPAAPAEATALTPAESYAGAHIVAGNSLIWLALVSFAGLVLCGIAKVGRPTTVQGAPQTTP